MVSMGMSSSLQGSGEVMTDELAGESTHDIKAGRRTREARDASNDEAQQSSNCLRNAVTNGRNSNPCFRQPGAGRHRSK